VRRRVRSGVVGSVVSSYSTLKSSGWPSCRGSLFRPRLRPASAPEHPQCQRQHRAQHIHASTRWACRSPPCLGELRLCLLQASAQAMRRQTRCDHRADDGPRPGIIRRDTARALNMRPTAWLEKAQGRERPFRRNAPAGASSMFATLTMSWRTSELATEANANPRISQES
jgi:hypothetical protein